MGFDVKKYSEERKKGTVNAVPENKENSSFDVASYAKQRKENNWNSKGVNSKSVNDFAKDMKVLRENISNGNHFSADKYKSALDLEAQYDYAGSRINKHIDDAYKYKTAISEDTGYYDSLYGQGSAARDQQTVDEILKLLHSVAADLENRKNVEFPKAVEYYDSLNPEMRVTKDTVVPVDEFGGKSTDVKFFETDDSMRKGGFIDNTWNSLLRGFYSSKYGTERYKEMQGQANEAEKYRKALEDDKFQFKSSGFGGAVSGAAELLGQMIYQTTNPRSTAYGAGMAGMAALAGNAGPQAIIPEEIITVPSAFAVGTAMGGALANYEIMSSYAYDEMLEYGIDENTAKTVAYVTGGLNALLESAQIDEVLSAFKVLNKVDGAASQSLAKIIAKELAERGVDIAKETGEEMLQETVTMGGVDWALRQNGQDGFSAEDYVQRIGETGVQSALSFGVMNMPAAGVNTYRAARGGNIPQENGVISDENAAKMQGKNDFSAENNEKEQNAEEILQALAEEMQQETVVEIDSDTGEIVADNAEEIVQQVENSAAIENADVESQDADLEAYAQQVADEIIAEFDLARSNSESANKEQASSLAENEMPENGKFEAVEKPVEVVENGVDFVKRAAQEIGLGAKGIETAVSAFENAPADRVYNSADFVKSFTAMYNDGKNGKPFGTSLKVTNVLNDRHLKMAYNAGLMDAITENSNTKQKRPAKVVRDKTKIIKRAKKSDWSSTDTTWYAPNEKTGKETIIAYSTTETSDLISVLAAENIDATISEIKDLVNYDVEAKKVLQAYIDSGFGQTKASDFFGRYVSLTKTLQEETAQGKIEAETYINENTENVEDVDYGTEETVSEVSDRGRILEPDSVGQMAGGLLDGVSSESVSENEKSGNVDDVTERNGRNPERDAGRNDSTGLDDLGNQRLSERDDLSNTARGIDKNPVYETSDTGFEVEDIDYVEWQQKKDAAAQKYSLSDEENTCLDAYVAGKAYELNSILRGEDQYESTIITNYYIENCINALDKFPKFKGRTYRNVDLNNKQSFDEFMKEYSQGKTVEFVAFSSASKDPNGYVMSGEYAVHLVIDGVSGCDISGSFSTPKQQEVIYLPGTKVVVDKIETANDGSPVIYAREESENGKNFGTDTADVGEDRQRVETSGNNSGKTSAGYDSAESRAEENRDDVLGIYDDREKQGDISEKSERPLDKSENVENKAPLKAETAKEQIQQKADIATQEKPAGNNFVIAEKGGVKVPTTPKARFKANVDAIKTMRNVMAENRVATPAEQEILAKYTGWGGVSLAFDANKAEWSKEYKQLKNLLTEEEYKTASRTSLDAYYTEPAIIRAMYKGLEKIGFKGGRLLEPSAGTGRFIGAMPESMLGNVKSWTAVELDNITGNIAKLLYPNADVRVQGFEKANIPDNYMDLVVGNVPFGNFGVSDSRYPKGLTSLIHNYFIAKSIDKVRPGGIVAVITSKGTMDADNTAARAYFARQADLIGAIRLPNDAFETTGTPVVSDILVFKKREANTPYKGEPFVATERVSGDGYWGVMNEYFAKHHDMILGKPETKYGRYGAEITVNPLDSRYSLATQIERAFAKINATMDYPAVQSQEQIIAEIKAANSKLKNGTVIKKDGKFYTNKDGVLEENKVDAKDSGRLTGIIDIRETARELLQLQLEDAEDSVIKAKRDQLNNLYDGFVKKHGPLNSDKNKRLYKNDVDKPFIQALENVDKDSGVVTKATIFKKNTVSPIRQVTHADSVSEGLTVVLNELGRIDVNRIAQLTGESVQSVEKQLIDTDLAYYDRYGNLEQAQTYLSGNVRAKLRDAKALAEGDKRYERNVKALSKIIPKDIAPEDIKVRPGATWIPDDVYSQFACEMLGGKKNWRDQWDIEVKYNNTLGKYFVEINDNWLKNRPANTKEWGTDERPFIGNENNSLLVAALNNKQVAVYDTMPDKSRVLNKDATRAAQEKLAKILTEFESWLWKDENRRKELGALYNEVFNNTVTPKYDGSKLTINGITPDPNMQMRPHQLNAVQRIINSGGNTLLAHRVGAGKTYEMAAAAMKLRQLGVVKKPVFIAPNHLVAQWGKEFLSYFPAAKILVVEKNDFSAANRKLFANRIATGDWDAVIMSYEQFEAVPMSQQAQEEFFQSQIDNLEQAIIEAKRAKNGKDPSVRDMERSKASFEKKLNDLADKTKKDKDNISFEEMGIDALFVDEAHNFKNLFYTTKMTGVSDLGNKEGSGRAFDLYMKTRYLQKLNGGRGIVFATATPVMNSVVEMYTMQRYLQPDLLEAKGLATFDAWANQFGEIAEIERYKADGSGLETKRSLSKYKNLAELQQMFRSFADVIVDAADLPYLKIPKMRTGKRIVVECEAGEYQKSFMQELGERAKKLTGAGKGKGDDHIFKIMGEGKMISYTQKMLEPGMEYEADGKVISAVNNVYNIWKDTKTFTDKDGNVQGNGTQLIFCDRGVPGGTDAARGINIYADMKNMLIGLGVPAREIAFIHDADSDAKKAELFKDINEGKVRILIGSYGKMSTGMNVQRRITAIHELNVPPRPGDMEQSEGRGLRQGNLNDDVAIYAYVTKGTYDAPDWDRLKRKATFINQVMAGEYAGREAEGDGEFAASAAEIAAIASGNPLIQEQHKVHEEIERLRSLQRAHGKSVVDAQMRAKRLTEELKQLKDFAQRYEQDAAAVTDTSGKKFSIVIDGKTYTERKAAGEALIAKAKSVARADNVEHNTEIGTFAGLKLLVTSKGDMLLKGKAQYRRTVNMESAIGTIQTLEAAPKSVANLAAETKARISEAEKAIPQLEAAAQKPFEHTAKMQELVARENEIRALLSADDKKAAENVSSADSEEQYSIVPNDNKDQWKAERVKGKQSAAKPLTEIIAKASHDLGIHVTSGHVRGAGVTGVFNPRHKGVRVRKTNDLPAIAHEFGHALDDRYGIVAKIPKDVKQELLDNYPDELKALYPEKEQPFEAVAEFVRKYLQNSEGAMLEYPKFAPYFLNGLSATDRAAFEQFADEVNAYFAAEAETATGAIRLREEKAPDYRTAIEKIEDKANVFRQAWVDAYHGIKRFDMALGSNVYRKAVNAAYAQNKAANILERDLTDIHGKVIGPGLKTALQGVNLRNTYEYRLFGEYLVVKHGPERLKEGMDVFADPRQNNAVWMAKRQKELEQQYPAFKQASERLYQFIADFHKAWGVDTDIISQEKLDSWQKRWEYYVPFNRAFMDEQTAGAKRGFANQHDPYKRAKGSTRDFVHPVDNIIDNVIKMVNISERNNVALSLADAARDLGADAGFIEKIPTPMVAKHYSMAKVKEDLNDKVLGEFAAGNIDADSFDAVNELVSGIDDVLTQYSNGKAHGDIITVLRGGEPEYWKVNDEQLLEGLTTMAPMERKTIMKAIAASTRFITASTTGNNPIWSVFSNAPRDLVTVLVYGKNKNIAKLLRDMGISYINSYRNQFKDGKGLDPLFSEYLAMGGGQTAVYNADTDMAKKVRKKISSTAWQDKLKSTTPLEHLRYFLDAIYFAGGATETAPRFATYKYLRENGMSSDEAFYEAMDVTVNFRRGGNYAKGVNSVIPFFNAGVQGLDKMVRYYSAADVSADKRKKVMKSRVVTGVAVSVALAALHYAINNYDDEHEKEYEQLSTYTKNNFICIPKGDGKFFCIPKPRDLAVLMSLSERVMEYTIGDNKHAYEEIVQYATDTALPPLVSDLVQYPVEIAQDGLETASINLLADITGSAGLFGVAAQAVANRDFLGRPIVSQSMQYSEGRNKYNQNVSRLAYELGQVLNFSPLLIDHFGENIISFWWNTQASLFPLDENRRDLTFGVANKYLKDNQYSNDLTNWMYDRKEENQIAKNSYPDDMNIAIDYKNDSNMTGFYSRYYSLAKREKETDRTRNTRQAVLDMIKDYQAACDSEYVTPAQRLVNNVVKETGDTSYLPGVMNDYIKDASETKHSLTSAQYYDYQTTYLGNYWNYVEQNVSNSMTTAEKIAYIKAAKTVAKERADETILGKQGVSSGHFDDYSGVSDDDLISFKAQTDIANDDGSLKQEEIVDILVLMVNDGLSFEDAYTLFHSKYDSDKNNPWKAYK